MLITRTKSPRLIPRLINFEITVYRRNIGYKIKLDTISEYKPINTLN